MPADQALVHSAMWHSSRDAAPASAHGMGRCIVGYSVPSLSPFLAALRGYLAAPQVVDRRLAPRRSMKAEEVIERIQYWRIPGLAVGHLVARLMTSTETSFANMG